MPDALGLAPMLVEWVMLATDQPTASVAFRAVRFLRLFRFSKVRASLSASPPPVCPSARPPARPPARPSVRVFVFYSARMAIGPRS
jgi:hypothetical protein